MVPSGLAVVTAFARKWEMSNIVVCCMANKVISAYYLQLCNIIVPIWKMRGLAFRCCHLRCAWHIYVNGRCIVVLFQRNGLGTRLDCWKGAWDGTCMVKVQCILLYSSKHQEGLCLKGRFSWSQAARRGPCSILRHKKLHILCCHLTWIPRSFACHHMFVKWKPKQTWHILSLASTMQFSTKL